MRLSASPRCVHVDIFEDNWVCTPDGKPTLRQIILWRWTTIGGVTDYFVTDWDLTERCIPAIPWGGVWVGVFKGRLIVAKVYKETAYISDIEVMDRARLPESARDKIQRPWPPKK